MRLRVYRLVIFLLFSCAAVWPIQNKDESELHYTIELRDPLKHTLHVTITMPAGSELHLQMPVWNATYQRRDFSRNVRDVRASIGSEGVAVMKVNPSLWRVRSTAGGELKVQYDTVADTDGPFGATYTSAHAFFNFAEVLMYPVEKRRSQVKVEILDAPPDWKAATSLPCIGGVEGGHARFALRAGDYDHLVDSPLELGRFTQTEFTLRHKDAEAKVRVVVDAVPSDFDLPKLQSHLQKITNAAVDWMDDLPFNSYVFLYHFPHGTSRGGMEHANSTAIDIDAQTLKPFLGDFDSVSAHEFFHLWNVKRIRPASLEPVDYAHEQYTRALWFSEGVTSTVGGYILLRSGLLSPEDYLRQLSDKITVYESSPARGWQSPEESSLDAWLEGYASYRLPERSVSYYTAGEILGVILDLEIRKRTEGRKSLRDLFQRLDEEYAHQKKPIPDSAGVQQAAEEVAGGSFEGFFASFVRGTKAMPYEEEFSVAGMRLVRNTRVKREIGVSATRNFDSPLVVTSVDTKEAAAAGIQTGDRIVTLDGSLVSGSLEAALLKISGSEASITVRHEHGVARTVTLPITSHTETAYSLESVTHPTSQQLAIRSAWLSGDSKPGAAIGTR